MKRLYTISLVALMFLWATFVETPSVYAETITVTTQADNTTADGQCSLREAIQNANDDGATFSDCVAGSGADTIIFSGAVTNITLTSPISLNSEILIDGGGTVTISGGGTTDMFVVTNNGVVTLERLTLTNGNNAGGGGAVRVNNDGALTVEQSNFNNNSANGDGGAINSNGTLSIDNTLFLDNTAGGDGGAIWQSSASPMTVAESAFAGNIAGDNLNGKGGAIYHNGQLSGPSAITATYFSNNRATNIDDVGSGGGAIFHNNGILAITASAFSGNNADGDFARGGAIYNNSTTDGAMAINYSHFGQTLSLLIPDFLTISITNPNTVTNAVTETSFNQQGGGGAIYNFGPLVVNGSSFIGNTSNNNGGAYNGRGTTAGLPIPLLRRVIIANSTFVNNSASNNGGAIYNDRNDSLLELINLTIANNTAGSGGGIFNNGDGESPNISNFDDVYVTNTIISNNVGGNCAGGSLGNGNASTSGNNVVFGSACDIRQQDGASNPAAPITGNPNLGTEQIEFSLPNILTIVRSLNAGSSALGAGDPTVCAAFPILNIDQRGPLGIRPQGDLNCDIGAFESPLPGPAPEINVQGNGVDIVTGDITPSLADHTDFGSTPLGTPFSRTFTIQNTGTADLTVAVPTVPAGFTVTADPVSPITAGNSTTFTVECSAVSSGTFTGTVSITNNDADENPYTFAIACNVIPPAPEINVQGNAVTIVSGDATPDLADHTDFGSTPLGTPFSRTFTIQNLGTADLTVAVPTVPAGFTVTADPVSPITAGNSTTFTVECSAVAGGTFNGTVSITNNDADENPYTFAITCNVTTAPEINVQGNGVDIVSGDPTPDLADHTDFGSTSAGTPISRVFTIQNLGTADLTVAVPSVPAGFTVTADPVSPITAGNSTTFTVECTAAGASTFTGNVSITNNDTDENPYTFALTCNVTAIPEPEINIQGNGVDIVSGDITPSLADHTDFGSTPVGTPFSRMFTIQNTGTADLIVTLPVSVSAGFTVTADPVSPITAGNSTTFTVECSAGGIGTFNGTVSITNNDADENPYTFAITCDVTALPEPEINVQGNGVDIVSGDATPDLADHTDFGTTFVGAPISRVFTIQNTGTADLTVTLPVSVSAGFTVTADPVSPITAGNSTTFMVECNAAGVGTFAGNVSITNNDADENPYTFAITCNVTATPQPEINVQGNGVTIVSGDATPSLADHTDFGVTLVGTPISRVFTVQNLGTADLTVTLPVSVPAGFSVTADPVSPITAGNSTTFTVECSAVAGGTFNGTVSITNNDADENPYTFAIACNVTTPAPEINVQGNGVDIVSGDITPSLADHTDFGSTPLGTPFSRTFTIQNLGTADLTVTLPLSVPAGFTVTADPVSPVTAGNSTTFTVECSAVAGGTFNGTVSITNNDADENPYTFAITCNVTTAPEINVQGNGIDIVSGDATPDLADHTDFGATFVGTPISRVFTIQNLGTADLTVTLPVSVPAGFTVTAGPVSPITAGNSTTFTVECNAAGVGTFSGNVSIINNDADENPYTFAITCNVTAAPQPEINVQGNGATIVSGDATPSLADHTNFGSTLVGTAFSRTFTIQNLGTADLTVTLPVSVPAGFSVIADPISPITAGNSTTFTVECNAAGVGTFAGNVSITNNDADENPYTFAITCNVVNTDAPIANIQGNGVTIVNGDVTPSLADFTSFGATPVGTATSRTFTIENVGTLNLTLGAVDLPAGFMLTTAPTSPITPSNSTTFTIQCDATTAGTFSGNITIPTNDPTNNPYTFAITCQVNPPGGGGGAMPGDTVVGLPQIDVFDPALSKRGLLLPGELGLLGERLQWVVTVTNNGVVTGTNVVFTDILRNELRVDGATTTKGTVAINGQIVTVTIGDVAPGEIITIIMETTVLESDISIDNTACVVSANGETTCVTAQAIPGLRVTQLPATGETPWWRSWILIMAGLGVGLMLWTGLCQWMRPT